MGEAGEAGGSEESFVATSKRSVMALLWPALVAVVAIVCGFALVRQLSIIGSWQATYQGGATFVVEECSTEPGLIIGRARCVGRARLHRDRAAQGSPDGDVVVASTMVGPLSAFGAVAPGLGDEIEVYHATGSPEVTYPAAAGGIELARGLLTLVPLTFVAVGAVTWLLGWWLTRGIDVSRAERQADRFRYPQRFVLRQRGALWAVVGLALLAADRFAVDELLGSAGLA